VPPAPTARPIRGRQQGSSCPGSRAAVQRHAAPDAAWPPPAPGGLLRQVDPAGIGRPEATVGTEGVDRGQVRVDGVRAPSWPRSAARPGSRGRRSRGPRVGERVGAGGVTDGLIVGQVGPASQRRDPATRAAWARRVCSDVPARSRPAWSSAASAAADWAGTPGLPGATASSVAEAGLGERAGPLQPRRSDLPAGQHRPGPTRRSPTTWASRALHSPVLSVS
jgi:hypothetical protein